jgi:hypothetical protein
LKDIPETERTSEEIESALQYDGNGKILMLRKTIRMTPGSYSLALASTPAIAVYLRETLWQLLGRKANASPNRLVRVEYGKGHSAGRVYGCFDVAIVRR